MLLIYFIAVLALNLHMLPPRSDDFYELLTPSGQEANSFQAHPGSFEEFTQESLDSTEDICSEESSNVSVIKELYPEPLDLTLSDSKNTDGEGSLQALDEDAVQSPNKIITIGEIVEAQTDSERPDNSFQEKFAAEMDELIMIMEESAQTQNQSNLTLEPEDVLEERPDATVAEDVQQYKEELSEQIAPNQSKIDEEPTEIVQGDSQQDREKLATNQSGIEKESDQIPVTIENLEAQTEITQEDQIAINQSEIKEESDQFPVTVENLEAQTEIAQEDAKENKEEQIAINQSEVEEDSEEFYDCVENLEEQTKIPQKQEDAIQDEEKIVKDRSEIEEESEEFHDCVENLEESKEIAQEDALQDKEKIVKDQSEVEGESEEFYDCVENLDEQTEIAQEEALQDKEAQIPENQFEIHEESEEISDLPTVDFNNNEIEAPRIKLIEETTELFPKLDEQVQKEHLSENQEISQLNLSTKAITDNKQVAEIFDNSQNSHENFNQYMPCSVTVRNGKKTLWYLQFNNSGHFSIRTLDFDCDIDFNQIQSLFRGHMCSSLGYFDTSKIIDELTKKQELQGIIDKEIDSSQEWLDQNQSKFLFLIKDLAIQTTQITTLSDLEYTRIKFSLELLTKLGDSSYEQYSEYNWVFKMKDKPPQHKNEQDSNGDLGTDIKTYKFDAANEKFIEITEKAHKQLVEEVELLVDSFKIQVIDKKEIVMIIHSIFTPDKHVKDNFIAVFNHLSGPKLTVSDFSQLFVDINEGSINILPYTDNLTEENIFISHRASVSCKELLESARQYILVNVEEICGGVETLFVQKISENLQKFQNNFLADPNQQDSTFNSFISNSFFPLKITEPTANVGYWDWCKSYTRSFFNKIFSPIFKLFEMVGQSRAFRTSYSVFSSKLSAFLDYLTNGATSGSSLVYNGASRGCIAIKEGVLSVPCGITICLATIKVKVKKFSQIINRSVNEVQKSAIKSFNGAHQQITIILDPFEQHASRIKSSIRNRLQEMANLTTNWYDKFKQAFSSTYSNLYTAYCKFYRIMGFVLGATKNFLTQQSKNVRSIYNTLFTSFPSYKDYPKTRIYIPPFDPNLASYKLPRRIISENSTKPKNKEENKTEYTEQLNYLKEPSHFDGMYEERNKSDNRNYQKFPDFIIISRENGYRRRKNAERRRIIKISASVLIFMVFISLAVLLKKVF